MDFQAVVLAGGIGKRFGVISSEEVPKAMLHVGNKPLLSYPLNMLADAGFSEAIVVTAGDDVGKCVSKFVERYAGRMQVQVVPVPEDCGTATALRIISPRLTSANILVLGGDLITDVAPSLLASAHYARDALATVLLTPRKQTTNPETGKLKPPEDLIGLDSKEERLLFCTEAAAKKELRVRRTVLKNNAQMSIRTDLLDTHMYILSQRALSILGRHPNMTSIKAHLLPYLARRQFAKLPSAASRVETAVGSGESPEEEAEGPEVGAGDAAAGRAVCTAAASERGGGVYVELLGPRQYATRVTSLASYSDANREVACAGEASHLTGYTLSKHDNVVDKSVELGQKTIVGPACIVGERCVLGDKSSIKRTVIGANTRLGNNVKVMNCVIGENVTIEDGCHLQNSIVCANAVLREKCSLRDCQVAAGYEVEVGAQLRSEELENEK